MILLCKFTTSGDSQGHTQGLVSTFFSLFLGGVEITSSSIQSFETWIKNDDQALLDLLKKGKRVKVEGFFKSETYQKDGKDHHVIKLIATSLSEVEKQKKEEAA